MKEQSKIVFLSVRWSFKPNGFTSVQQSNQILEVKASANGSILLLQAILKSIRD